MRGVCITSHGSLTCAGGETGGIEFLGNDEEITVYAGCGGGDQSRFLNVYPVPKEGTEEASPRESTVCFSECCLLPSIPQNEVLKT